MNKRQEWDKAQVKAFVKQAKSRWGTGWDRLSNDMKKDAIMAQVLLVLLGQIENAYFNPQDMRDLLTAMMKEAGVEL